MEQKSNELQKPASQKSDVGFYIIIVAGGSGTRMNSDIPKQFIELKGKPVFNAHHTKIVKMLFSNINIILVLSPAYNELWKTLCQKHHFNISHQLTAGGRNAFSFGKNTDYSWFLKMSCGRNTRCRTTTGKQANDFKSI